MKEERSKAKVIGLNLELATLVSALHAMRVILEGGDGQREALAILGLVSARIALLRAVVKGEIDPALAWSDHAASVPENEARATDDPELRLVAWTKKEATAIRARRARR